MEVNGDRGMGLFKGADKEEEKEGGNLRISRQRYSCSWPSRLPTVSTQQRCCNCVVCHPVDLRPCRLS